jgi:uncharacterized membrane protein
MRHTRAGFRLTVALATGAVVGIIISLVGADALGPLVGWDVAAIIFVGWAWKTAGRLGAPATADLALREDPGRAAVDSLILVAAVASLAAVGLVILAAGPHSGIDRNVAAMLSVVSVFLSWALVHTVFTARYARLYYAGRDGGVDFNESDPPAYVDFAYLAFTIGMTYQVSDTDLTSKAVRRTALRHALLSYFFGTVIIAAMINLIVGLAR